MSGPTQPVAYLVIAPTGEVTFKRDLLSVAVASDIVGGEVEVQAPPKGVPGVSLIANAEGHRLGLDANWHATRLIRGSLRPSDFLTGNVIVVGDPDRTGEWTSITSEQEKAVREAVADK